MRGAVAGLIVLVLVPIVGLVVPTAGAATTVTVNVGANFFSPAALQLTMGDTVRWQWMAGVHSVTQDGTDVDWCATNVDGAHPTCSRSFPIAGAFAYHCKFHVGMQGSIRVIDPAWPDLVVTDVAFVDEPDGEPDHVFVTLRNTGLTAAPASVGTVSVRSQLLSERTLGQPAVPRLESGASAVVDVEWSAAARIGTFTLKAVADAGAAVQETMETNNQFEDTVTFVVAGPGLAVPP